MNCHLLILNWSSLPVEWTLIVAWKLIWFMSTVAWIVTIFRLHELSLCMYHWSASCWQLHELSPFTIDLLLVDGCMNCHHLKFICFLLIVAWTVTIYYWTASCWRLHELSIFWLKLLNLQAPQTVSFSQSIFWGNGRQFLLAMEGNFFWQWKALSSGNGRLFLLAMEGNGVWLWQLLHAIESTVMSFGKTKSYCNGLFTNHLSVKVWNDNVNKDINCRCLSVSWTASVF